MFLRCTNSCRSCLGTRPATYYIHEQGGGGRFWREIQISKLKLMTQAGKVIDRVSLTFYGHLITRNSNEFLL